jgi:hypothetical protein
MAAPRDVGRARLSNRADYVSEIVHMSILACINGLLSCSGCEAIASVQYPRPHSHFSSDCKGLVHADVVGTEAILWCVVCLANPVSPSNCPAGAERPALRYG